MRRWGAECAGTATLVVIVCCILSSAGALAPVAIGAVTAILLALGARADCSFNPAVTAARWIRGQSDRELAGALAAQLVGGLVAAVAARVLLGGRRRFAAGRRRDLRARSGGRAGAGWPWRPWRRFGAFGLVYLTSQWQAADGTGRRHGLLATGLAVSVMTAASGPVCAGLFNPATGIAAAAVGLISPEVAAAGAAAQLCGAVAAGLTLGNGARLVAPSATVTPGRRKRAVHVVGRSARSGSVWLPRPRSAGDLTSAAAVPAASPALEPVSSSGT